MTDSPTPTPAAGPEPVPTAPSRRDRRERTAAGVLLVGLVVMLALTSWSRVTGPFGDSDEGLDTSVWAMCTRALRDDPWGSALGGQRPDGVDYANHPPLTCLGGGLVEAVAGEREWATRGPAWLATTALVPLVYLLLRRLRFTPLLATAGTLAAVGTPMVVVYGSMLDTPIVALPFAAAVVAAVAGEWPAGDDPPRRWPGWLVGVLAALAGLAGWQAGLTALLCGGAVLWWGHDRRRAVPYLAGAVLGLATSLAWAAWTYGTLLDLTDKLAVRSGGGGTLLESLSFQLDWVRILLGASTFALLACVAALTDREIRPVAAVLLTAVAVWSVVLYGGAGGHQFWNYATILPAAVGAAWALRGMAGWIDGTSIGPRGEVVVVALAAVLAVVQVTSPTLAERLIDEGHPVGRELAALRPPEGATQLAVVGDDVRPYAIVVYYTGLLPKAVDETTLRELAEDDPDTPVLVVRPCPEPTEQGFADDRSSAALCRALPGAETEPSELTTAGQLVAALG